MTDWLEASQVCFAQILEGRKSPKAFLAEDFHETYYDAVKHVQETEDWSKESLVKIIAPSFIQDATHQLHSLNGMGETTDWTKIMQDFAADYRLAQVYKKAARSLERGKAVDFLAISGHTQARVLKDSHGPTPLADIDCSNYEPFMPSGDDATDTILGGWPTDGPIIVYGLTGVGKCFAPGTKVLMYDGTIKNVEDVRVGDKVMGDDSKPRNVLETHFGSDVLYDVIPTKGNSYRVNSEHILSLKITNGSPMKEYSDGALVEVSVRDYLSMPNRFKHIAKGYKKGVYFKAKPYPIDPYFLGVWLGDGDSVRPCITSVDNEIIEFLYNYANRIGMNVSIYRGDAYMIYTKAGIENRLTSALKRLDVINNKHIPDIYKTNHESVRLQVLAGLLDTDGSMHNNCYDFVSKYETLADDVVYLSQSLGLAAHKVPCEKVCTNNGKIGKYFRVYISGNTEIIPTKLPRKQATRRMQKKDPLVMGIRVEYAGIGKYYGFAVDGNHRFLLADFTVVHNSHWLASRMAKFLMHHTEKRGIVYTLEMGAKHWKWRESKMYPYIKKVEDRFLVSGEIRGIDDLVAEVSAGQYDIVGIDDMDGLARENSAAEYESMYKKIREVCRFLHIPVIALGQPNRGAKLAGRFLQKYDVAWSGAAENSAALLVALQIANELDLQDNQPFPAFDDDHEYEIIWKSRDGWPGDYPEKFPKGQFGPGAIIRKMVKGKKWEGEPLGRKIDEKTGEILSNGTLWRAYGKVAWKPKNKKKKEYEDE